MEHGKRGLPVTVRLRKGTGGDPIYLEKAPRSGSFFVPFIIIRYNISMKIKVSDFVKKFRAIAGDETISIPDDMLINALNWAFNSLPSVPKLELAFAKHYTENLDANGHYKWRLGEDFRRIADILYLNFFTSTGGDPCPLKLCNRDNVSFFKRNGVIELKVSGQPCEYTLEREDDDTYLVLDRPSNIPIIIDYIAYGYPKPVQSMKDSFECSAVIENLILSAIRRLYYMEASDFAFAGSVQDYLSNVEIVEAIQMLNKRYGNEACTILGEM